MDDKTMMTAAQLPVYFNQKERQEGTDALAGALAQNPPRETVPEMMARLRLDERRQMAIEHEAMIRRRIEELHADLQILIDMRDARPDRGANDSMYRETERLIEDVVRSLLCLMGDRVYFSTVDRRH